MFLQSSCSHILMSPCNVLNKKPTWMSTHNFKLSSFYCPKATNEKLIKPFFHINLHMLIIKNQGKNKGATHIGRVWIHMIMNNELGTAVTKIFIHFWWYSPWKSLFLGSINNTIKQSVDECVLVDSDKGKESHCSGRMLLCTLKIRLFRVEREGFHIINVATDCPHDQ